MKPLFLSSSAALGVASCISFATTVSAQPFFVPGQWDEQFELHSASRIGPTRLRVVFSESGETATAFIEAEIDCKSDMSRLTKTGVTKIDLRLATGHDRWGKNGSFGWGRGVTDFACTKMGMR